MSQIEFTVNCQVTGVDGKKLGTETHSFVFPQLEEEEGHALEVAINNISETQQLCGDLAKQCALSATWKAARTLVSQRQPEGPATPEELSN